MPRTVPFVKAYSDKEREHRWQKARNFMQQNGLDALLIIGEIDDYLSGWMPRNTVIFPLKGEPTLLTSSNNTILAIRPETPKEERPWFKDVRAGGRGSMIVAALKEKKLDKSHIGVVGLSPIGTGGGGEGWISYGTWHRVASRLPEANLEDVTRIWGEATFIKSEEELAHVRRAARVLELASEAMLKAARAGANELKVWAAIKAVLDKNGVHAANLILRTTPYAATWGAPMWISSVGSPRVFQPGDVVLAELFADSGGCQAQTQMAVAIPPVSAVDKECARMARLSYEAGLRTLRPGNTFEQVVAAMEEPLNLNAKDSKVWTLTPLIHSMNPMLCIGPTGVHIERMPGVKAYPQIGSAHIRGGEMVLKPGMVFELEPNACIGLNRVNIGGTVLVTKGKPEELNEVPCRMRVAEKA
ncbi:MAG: aminopeptidase P family protein [Chloroflexi bacterium]|nr:aminopeptidase P family protein [Chloroflexota bacterium]